MLSKTESQRCFHNACLYTIHNFKELEFKCFYFQTFSSKLLEFLIVNSTLNSIGPSDTFSIHPSDMQNNPESMAADLHH